MTDKKKPSQELQEHKDNMPQDLLMSPPVLTYPIIDGKLEKIWVRAVVNQKGKWLAKKEFANKKEALIYGGNVNDIIREAEG